MKFLIKNGRVIDPASGTDETLDILIEKKKISRVATRIDDPSARIIDAARKVVAPGFIDMHVHLREPGQEHKETIKTGTAAAARGGFTSVACMANTSPPNDNAGITEFILSQARKVASVHVFPIASVTKGLKGESLTEMAELRKAGAVAFSDDGFPVMTSENMRRALEYSKIASGLIIDHCEDLSLSSGGVMNEGYTSHLLGLKGIPDYSEDIIAARDIILAEKIGTPVHLAHISTRGSIHLIREAKSRGVPVTCEATPHHLFLDDTALKSYSTSLKVNPPIRSRDDREALLQALQDRTVDVLATDHAPHSPEEKDVEFDQAPFGINGLETAVPLFLDKLVNKDVISLLRFVEMISTNPARILGLNNKGRISAGADADLTILNLRKKITVDTHSFLSKSRNNPFHGMVLRGVPETTIVSGEIVYSA
jgi:dihydroorotase